MMGDNPTTRIDLLIEGAECGRKRTGNMAMGDDIQRIFEILTTLQVDVGVVKTNVASLLHSVDGNGKPGLKERTTVMEQSLITLTQAHKDCPAREAISGSSKRHSLSNTIAIGSLVVAVVAIWMAAR